MEDTQAHLDEVVDDLDAVFDDLEAELATLKAQPAAAAVDFSKADALVAKARAAAPPPAPIAPAAPVTPTAPPADNSPAAQPPPSTATASGANPQATAPQGSVGARPVYTYDADPTTVDTTEWKPAGLTTTDGHPLWFFSGDQAGDIGARGDGINGVWHVYTGKTLGPVQPDTGQSPATSVPAPATATGVDPTA